MRATFWSLFEKLEGNRSISEAKNELLALAASASFLLGEFNADAVKLLCEALAQKDQLAHFGKAVLERIFKQQPEDCSGRYEQMREAYGMLCLTAFFDELDAQLPGRIRKLIGLSQYEKERVYQDALSEEDSGTMEKRIPLPALLHGTAEQELRLTELYEEMGARLLKFVQGLAFRDVALEAEVLWFENIVRRLPKDAVKRFRDQYLILCGRFNEFYIFTQQEWEKSWQLQLDERFQGILSVALNGQNSSQAGMAELHKAIIELPDREKEKTVQAITTALIDRYRKLIERPIVETTVSSERLTYPRISQTFIPQAYKVLEYTGVEYLSLPETWERPDLRRNMMVFWSQYLLDPGSTERLLLILGEPGSGKSMLTKILCARLISPDSIFIRIPLREHNVEEDIETIVCRQLEWDGDAKGEVKSFKWFAQEFPSSPLTLVFDGYDEVLRAAGSACRGLLRQIRKFQERCYDLRRPVRVLVTSRTVLIDKAEIPNETIVMKLQEFDGSQKDQWIKIWNRHNHAALSSAGISDFALPPNSREIEELSGQPLLLMMLAIYDADFRKNTNALMQKVLRAETLDRTGLYDELLRRFIQRELREKNAKVQMKGECGAVCFEELNSQEQLAVEDEEMRRLGIAALGMLGRGRLFIQAEELDADLRYLGAEKPNRGAPGKTALRDAEILFGSFFFIHKSQAVSEHDGAAASFEFLHKTFYEFLVSDLVVQCVADTAYDLYHESNGMARDQETLYCLERGPKAYYALLSSVCLYAEPEIIGMMAEWAERKIRCRFHQDYAGFAQVMERILTDHITLLQDGRFALPVQDPSWLAQSRIRSQTFASYFMNLLVLQILTRKWINVDLDDWRFLAQYVRLYLVPPCRGRTGTATSEDFILKFMAQFQINWTESHVVLQRRAQNSWESMQNSLLVNHILLAEFMLDETAAKFYSLHSSDVPATLKKQYRRELYDQGFTDLQFELNTDKMQEAGIKQNLQQFPYEFIGLEYNYLGMSASNAEDLWGRMAIFYQLACRTAPPVWPASKRSAHTGHSWKVKRTITGDYDACKIFGKILFAEYLSQPELIRLYIALMGKLGCQFVLLDPKFINSVIADQLVVLPELVDAILEAGSAGFYQGEHYPAVKDAEERLRALSETLPCAAAVLLRYLYFSGQLSISAPVWKELESRWAAYLCEFPKGLSDMLQVYLEVGKFESVRIFFEQTGGKALFEQLYPHPELMDSFLNLMQTVGTDAMLCVELAKRIETEPGLIGWYPRAFFRLVYHATARNCCVRLDRTFWVRFFLQQYRINFGLNPGEAAGLLVRIHQRGFSEYARIVEAAVFSLGELDLILDQSVKTAARLLLTFERIRTDSRLPEWIETANPFVREQFESCIEQLPGFAKRCFRAALSARNEDDAPALAELLDDLGTDTRKDVVYYLHERLPLIRAYSEKLAEKAEGILSKEKVENPPLSGEFPVDFPGWDY